jgi:NADH dehydrogenase
VTVVWTAGITPHPLIEQLGLPTDHHGRVIIEPTLAVRGMDRVWALGDCAAVPNAAAPGEFDPATCQHALRQARRLVRDIGGGAKAYRYRTRGQMVTLGTRHGIAVVGGMRVRRLLGWAIARGYHLIQLLFASRRIRVMARLGRGRDLPRDVAELTDGSR